MKVTIKQLFSLTDGRLSTEIDKVYEMLNYIYSANFFTHMLPVAMDKLKAQNPAWFNKAVKQLDEIKDRFETNDFYELMKILDEHYADVYVNIYKEDFETLIVKNEIY